MHQGAPECTTSDPARLDTAEGAPECNISARECGCGKALEALRGKVAEAISLLDDREVARAREVLRGALQKQDE
jgi:hypothetical protein